jgi:hypothetical protein
MCKTRKCPGFTLGFFAIGTLMLGIAMVVLSIRFSTSGFSKDVKALGNYQNAAFYMLLAGAITAVLTGVCGIIVCARRVHIVFNIFTGFFFLIAFLLLFVNGITIAFVSNTKPETLQKFCSAPTDDQGFIVVKIKQVFEQVDETVGGVVSKNMCSSGCPCEPSNNQTAWTSLTQE